MRALNKVVIGTRLALTALGALCLCFSSHAAAQASAQIVPGIAGCKDAVIYNTSQHHLQLSVDYLYEGTDGAYQRGTASCVYASGMSTAPGQSCQIGLWSGPVNCGKPYTAKTLATKWTDMTVIWERERRAAEIEQNRERENTMALARMLDEKNRRESEARAKRNEEARRQHEAELAAKRAEQERALAHHQQDPMGLTRGMHGPIPQSQAVSTPSSGSNLNSFEQQVRAEQEERDRLENNNKQLAYENAARERYDREATQRQQQAEAQAKAAQAAAERQRQQRIAAEAAAAERARQEAERREAQSRALNAMQTELIGSSAQQSEQKLFSRKTELANTQQSYKGEEADLDKMLAMMESSAASGRRTSELSGKSLPTKLASEECSRLSGIIDSGGLPENADHTRALETLMFIYKTAVQIIDGGCPIKDSSSGRASVRQSFLRDYAEAENDCNAIQVGGRRCIAQKHYWKNGE